MRISNNQIFFQSLSGMLGLQGDVQKYQLQISSGKRLQSAADDPVAAAQVLNLGDRLGALAQYDRNANLATLRLSDQETAIDGAQNVLQRVRELVLSGKNASMTTADRRYVATEIGERLKEVLNLANTKNASGEYIFSGTAVGSLPFTRDATGNVVYNGNQAVRELAIADGRTIAEGASGADVFMGIRNGNGTFVTGLGATNTGTGRVINDSVVDPAAYTAHAYRIVFTAPDTYNVVDDTAGTTLASGQPYTDGSAIKFDGVSVAITGAPAAGDEFTIGPSQNQSIFATISRAQQDLSVDLTSDQLQARFSFNMDQALANIDQALDNLNSVRAQIGARQQAIDAQGTTNSAVKLQLETFKSKLQDVDMVEAVSHLARQTQALEAAQQAFVRVQGLSLFNYLG